MPNRWASSTRHSAATARRSNKQIRLLRRVQARPHPRVGKHINFKPEVTHQEMLDYYREHAADYAVPAKARFEILTVKFASFRDRREAGNAIAQMGNAVYLRHALRRRGPQAFAGAQCRRTAAITTGPARAAWPAKPIDQAIFTLEVGKLSQIIEDERGYHIVRVIERHAAGQVSFLEAQAKIKEAITVQKREADYKKFVQQLGTGTKVWTIYDDAAATARQPSATQPR